MKFVRAREWTHGIGFHQVYRYGRQRWVRCSYTQQDERSSVKKAGFVDAVPMGRARTRCPRCSAELA